ncbi:MAG: HAD-IIB family hydrolase [Bifidobacteriaceae bacterium]|nr:HAD-IIB family hydrolase [Bifidobacteriaceae bacterium]
MSEVIITEYNDAHAQAICKKSSVLAFDLDGTLASSRQPMSDSMAQVFAVITQFVQVAIITGGRLALVHSQILDKIIPLQANVAHLHLMPTSGSSYYVWGDGDWTSVYEYNIPKHEREQVIASINKHAHDLHLDEDKSWGVRIEDRGSQITFSALGQDAPLSVKETWDVDGGKRIPLVERLRKEFPSLEIHVGGLTSVDISLRGIDKQFAIQQLAKHIGCETSQITFLGDRMKIGGNDYPAAVAGARVIHVNNPDNTLELCKKILEYYKSQD